MLIRIKKGLDLPISGTSEQIIHDSSAIETVALVGDDYIGLRPGLIVSEGDRVRPGQTLIIDKHTQINVICSKVL